MSDGRTTPRVSVTFSDPDVIAALKGNLVSNLGHWDDGDNEMRLALWSVYHRLADAEKRLRSKRVTERKHACTSASTSVPDSGRETSS